MYIVADVNVIISSLLTSGDSFNVFALNSLLDKVKFVAPEFLLVELDKHKSEIKERAKIDTEKFEENLNFVIRQIDFIPDSEFNDKIDKAKKILGENIKDCQYLALALKLNCQIFSGDKRFKESCPDKVLNPKEMLAKILFELK